MRRWIKVVEVIGEVGPEEVEGLNSNAWKFRWVEAWEEIVGVEGEKPTVGDIVEFFVKSPVMYQVAEVVKVIREIEPNVWEVRVRREVEGIWLIEGMRPEEGQILDTEEHKDSLWMTARHPFKKGLWVAGSPRFFFEKG